MNIVVVIIDLNVLGFVEMYVYVIVVVQQRVRSCKLTLIHCKNLRVVLTFYGYLSCTFYKHPVSNWDVPFTMAT